MEVLINIMPQSLNGQWQLRKIGSDEWLPAIVPGSVHTDLLAAGRIPDPFVGDNEKRVQWVAEHDWEYRRTFVLDPQLPAGMHIHLVCDGLDTLAEVRLNGGTVGAAKDMFHPHRWEVTDLLRAGENEMSIVFRSPVRYVEARERIRPMPGVGVFVIKGGPHLRKAPSHFGWDWGPMLPTLGIWRDIRLEGHRLARLDDVQLHQQHVNGSVTLSAALSTQAWESAPLRASLRLTAPGGRTQTAETPVDAGRATLALKIEQPQLWWPNGLGAQPLYRAEVVLLNGDDVLAARLMQIGLRTVELNQQPDEWGRSFTFVVNGVPMFATGANWIPADSFPARVTPAQLEHLLQSAADAHFNMIRIWGGGYYEAETFYDLCDRLGLLVWQDFMFACAGYPFDDPEFLETLQHEVTHTVRRLRHRACLALWCGNNEMEQGWVQWGWSKPENEDLKAAYDRFFHHLLPSWVIDEDPNRPYWPSSPSSGMPFVDPNGGAAGDVHQWAVWHALKPFVNYRETQARFVSEFGFQSLPALSTIAAYAEPSEWNMTSYVMEHHQRHLNGNGKIVNYLTNHFRLPKDFPSLVYLTQILQAEALRTGVEHWRRHPACSGTLYWQLNDCWPVASWSSIDYFGRWKAAHYAARRFYAPILLSVADDGERRDVFVTNDTPAAWQGEVRWSLQTLHGESLVDGEERVIASPLSTTLVKALDFTDRLTEENRRRVVLACDLWQADRHLATSVTPFVPDKHLELEPPQIAVDVRADSERLTMRLLSRSLARFVELSLRDIDVIFSDNYFDLPAGRTIAITCSLPDDWTAEHSREALTVRSLRDSY